MRAVNFYLMFLLLPTLLWISLSNYSASEVVTYQDKSASIKGLFKAHCGKCHTGEKAEAEIDLGKIHSQGFTIPTLNTWKKILDVLASGQMPPLEEKELPAKDRSELTSWIKGKLSDAAKNLSPDPGPISFKRLSQVEYNNSIRDLTGVDLQPGRDFPKEGAAGEGFGNATEALGMTPALFNKYLDASRKIASHTVLLPDGFRFSKFSTRRDWTDDLVDEIRLFYSQFADKNGGYPLEQYLRAAKEFHQKKTSKPLAEFAQELKLNERYLALLIKTLSDPQPSFYLKPFCDLFKQGDSDSIPKLVAEIQNRHKVLWKTNSVGHFKMWHEPEASFLNQSSFRIEAPKQWPSDLFRFKLIAQNQGGEKDDFTWQNVRFSAPGRPSILLKELPALAEGFKKTSQETFSLTAKYLEGAVHCGKQNADPEITAKSLGLDPKTLLGWMDLLGIFAQQPWVVKNYLGPTINSSNNYQFIRGWGKDATPLLITNSSNQTVQVPGTMPGKSVCVHPSVTEDIVVGWRSPAKLVAKIDLKVEDAHATCGNGVTWVLEIRRGNRKRVLANGVIDNGAKPQLAPLNNIQFHKDDLLTLAIGPRDRNHVCDLTLIDLEISDFQPEGKKWKLSKDIAETVLAGNPHADSFGNTAIWHFFSENSSTPIIESEIPNGSSLAHWRDAYLQNASQETMNKLALRVQNILTSPAPEQNTPDGKLFRHLFSIDGPLFRNLDFSKVAASQPQKETPWGISPQEFAKINDVGPGAGGEISFQAPGFLVRGRFLETEAVLSPNCKGLIKTSIIDPSGKQNGPVMLSSPNSQGRKAFEKELRLFRDTFPPALCYPKIVPVDEVITLVLHHRDDEALKALFLNPGQTKKLNRLWQELEFVSQDPLRIQDAYPQFMEYASQENLTQRFTHLKDPIWNKAEQFSKELKDAESLQWSALENFASRAFRRPLINEEKITLKQLYTSLRSQMLSHEEAFQLTLASIFTSPSFLYKRDLPENGKGLARLQGWELAVRLSYFLWSSIPDEELARLGQNGQLLDNQVLKQQMARMLKDPKARALATEFACQWLDFRAFDLNDEKNEKLFPEFAALRGAMYEEAQQYFIYLFAENRPVLEIIQSDYLFVNEALARHYGIPGIAGPEWRRLNGAGKFGRGGILAMAAPLAAQSGASRTSPILRGTWVSESLLGEKLPKPPPNVPQLPEQENSSALSVRQLVEQHSSNPKCAICHDRIDPMGFALEKYDAIGRLRIKDGGGHTVSTQVVLKSGEKFDGISGLQAYLLGKRGDDFLRTFCKKLLGYALGRGTTLADEPLIDSMASRLRNNEFRIQEAIIAILESKQFTMKRGAQYLRENEQ